MTDQDKALLKLGAKATLEDLKRAYRKAALELHPDQNPDPAAALKFRQLTEAYNRLATQLPPKNPPKRAPSLEQRTAWLVIDAESLLKRWKPEQWQAVIDGLPAIVWLTSVLDVLAERWLPPGPRPERPTREAVAVCLDAWQDWLKRYPAASRGKPAKALVEALTAAEARLKALGRPLRTKRHAQEET